MAQEPSAVNRTRAGRARRQEILTEGYGRALALEAERRRLHERQLELADLAVSDENVARKLATLTRREARLGRLEHELRAILTSLKNLNEHRPPRLNTGAISG
jgi:hypothetical protein